MTAPEERARGAGRSARGADGGHRCRELGLGEAERRGVCGRELLELLLQPRQVLVLVGLAGLVGGKGRVPLHLGIGQTRVGGDAALSEVGELDLEPPIILPPTLDETLHPLLGPREDLTEVERERVVVDRGHAGLAVALALAPRVAQLSP